MMMVVVIVVDLTICDEEQLLQVQLVSSQSWWLQPTDRRLPHTHCPFHHYSISLLLPLSLFSLALLSPPNSSIQPSQNSYNEHSNQILDPVCTHVCLLIIFPSLIFSKQCIYVCVCECECEEPITRSVHTWIWGSMTSFWTWAEPIYFKVVSTTTTSPFSLSWIADSHIFMIYISK